MRLVKVIITVLNNYWSFVEDLNGIFCILMPTSSRIQCSRDEVHKVAFILIQKGSKVRLRGF